MQSFRLHAVHFRYASVTIVRHPIYAKMDHATPHMLSLLWFLLPVAAAAGWFAGRRSTASRPEAFWNYSTDFHESLNELLNHTGELPSSLFDKLSNTERDTADTHLALGNLYRRRGDTNRAILLHESLLDRPELGEQVHSAALLALAQDYDSAGLLDRSELTLRKLIKTNKRLPEAYAGLQALHERESDWMLAIDVADETQRVTAVDRSSLIAHYYCELASKASTEGNVEDAKKYANKALERSEQCARAHMLLAEIASSHGDNNQALNHYAQVESLRPELMPDIIDARFDALIKNGDESVLRTFIDRIRDRRNAYSVVRTTREVIEKIDGLEKADRFFKKQLLQRPSLKGLRDWAQDQVAISKPDEREKVQIIFSMLDKIVEDKATYQCGRCGFLGNELHWRCPSCSKWDSVQPIIGLEGE